MSRVRSGSSGRRSCRKFTTEDLQGRGRGYGELGAEEAGRFGTDEQGALDATNCRPDIAHDQAKVDVPTLVMAGSENPLVPRDALESTARTVPNGAGVALPGGGQFSNIVSTGPFDRALPQFLDAR